MNKVERYFIGCVEDIKKQYGNDIKELSSKVRQLTNQARGYVRDCFIIDFQDYALEQIVRKQRGGN